MSEYQELLINEYAKQYATNWFKMDEGSGTILNDSKGSAVGTINGATWLENGGLSFDGVNDSVNLGRNVYPIGAKSIFFKFKGDLLNGTKSNNFIINNTNYTSTSTIGLSIIVNDSTNEFIIVIEQGSSASRIFRLSAGTYPLDNQWHDILFTWDGTTNIGAVKLYIDDMETPYVTTTATRLETATSSNNLMIGRSVASIPFEIKGLAIWNEDITQLSLDKSLILHDGEYKKWNGASKTWETISSIVPTSTQFLEQGTDELSPLLDRKPIELAPIEMIDSTSEYPIVNGKLFTKNISKNDYSELISVKVTDNTL